MLLGLFAHEIEFMLTLHSLAGTLARTLLACPPIQKEPSQEDQVSQKAAMEVEAERRSLVSKE